VTIDETDNEKSRISRRELLQRGLIGGAGIMGLSALTLADVENA